MADNGNNGGNNNGGNNNGGNNNGGNGNGNNNPAPTLPTLAPIPASAPAGLLTITQPPQSATSYYKLAPNNPITFGWNTSYILRPATSYTVSAICNNGNSYPVGPDPSGHVPGDATEVVWDAYAWQTEHPELPLPEDVCTLAICDERGYGAQRRGGYLSPNTALQFALYSPKAYTAIADGWKCTVCNSGYTTNAHPVMVSLIVTMFICLLSGIRIFRQANAVQPAH